MLAGLTITALAADKDLTLTGEAQCGKCILKKTPTCQMVIQVNEQGKKHNYYVVANDVSKAFKEDFCAAPKKVTAIGSLRMVSGKRELTLSKISLDK